MGFPSGAVLVVSAGFGATFGVVAGSGTPPGRGASGAVPGIGIGIGAGAGTGNVRRCGSVFGCGCGCGSAGVVLGCGLNRGALSGFQAGAGFDGAPAWPGRRRIPIKRSPVVVPLVPTAGLISADPSLCVMVIRSGDAIGSP